MSNYQNVFPGSGAGFNNNNQDFPSLGGQQQQQNQNQFQQQMQGGFPPQQFGGFPPAQFQQAPPQQNANPFAQMQAPAAQAAPATGAAPANPFAAAGGANPFAAAASSNPFGGAAVKEFKPKDPRAIMDDDDAPVDFEFGASKKKKQKTPEELAAEKAKAKAESDAKLSYKGKPSTFFIMDHVPGDQRDSSGNCRVPTSEQSVFIFTHYPTESLPDRMIAKLYQLYAEAAQAEENEKRANEAYKKPANAAGAGRTQYVETYEETFNDEEDTTFGAIPKKQTKKTQKQAVARDAETKRPVKDPTKKTSEADKAEAKQKKVSAAIKDIVVTPEDDVVPVDETKQPASFVFIGHVDAGKSTICGNLIYSMGIVDQRTIEKFKKEAKDKGRDSWWLAYVMDSSDEEKAKGKTVEIGRAVIDTATKMYTIFDAPGHKNYVPNMIMGATLADFGGLVISARRGEFEAGFEQDGQTREHIQLARSLGISKLVVVVNKMDEATVSWKKSRWDQIQSSLTPFLSQCGYQESDIYWVPISGLTGANIVESVSNTICSWYSGPTLLEILDNMPIEPRNAEAPLRIPILDKMKDSNRTVVFGKVEQGTVRLGDRLAVAPHNSPCQVLTITNDKQQSVEYGRPGDNVMLKISYLDEEQVFKGDVLCPRDQLMPVSQVLEAEIELLDLLKPIFSKGSQSMMHIHTYADEISVKEIIWAKELDHATKEEVKKDKPKFTRAFAKCLVRISTKVPIPVEKVSECASLGRFTLRDEGKTIAVGRITRFIPFNKEKAAAIAAKADAPVASGESKAAAASDKVAPIVFNLESGETEAQKAALGGIAEEDEKEDRE